MTGTGMKGDVAAMDNQQDGLWDKIENLASRSDALFLKKLSRNDTSWASDKRKHQAGFYVPSRIREAGFFPRLSPRVDKPHIHYAPCPSLWPQTGEVKQSGMRHFTNKGPETHFTVIPNDLFKGLSPASWLLAGRLRTPIDGTRYWFIVIDSESDDAEILETYLDIDADFHCEVIPPDKLLNARALAKDDAAELIDQLQYAIKSGKLDEFIRSVSQLPHPSTLAGEAQKAYFKSSGFDRLDPYHIEAPGDAVMRISRDFEYQIFKRYELRRRAAEVVGTLSSQSDMVTAVVRGFPALDGIFLSASQQRKTRAGRSFENHLASLLAGGNIHFEAQAVLGGKRPDFVLPDKRTLNRKSEKRAYFDAAILSAKTTLRERWKQITHERFNCGIFLATVDDRVSPQALDEMQHLGIVLVVPESMKDNRETFYQGHRNVISFRTFFDEEIKSKRPGLIAQKSMLKAPPESGFLF